MISSDALRAQLAEHVDAQSVHALFVAADDMVTLECFPADLLTIAEQLKNDPALQFSLLLDVCGVDYSDYGKSTWRTTETTGSGFSRGTRLEASPREQWTACDKPRFAVVYHFLSISLEQRVRLRVLIPDEKPAVDVAPQLFLPSVPSVVSLWPSANWYERETFDLFGIVFDGHPDLRRLLTDYGFTGHPFRKDFPLIGEVELRYDAATQRCVYEPVSIAPRVLVPKVIRHDGRYAPSDS